MYKASKAIYRLWHATEALDETEGQQGTTACSVDTAKLNELASIIIIIIIMIICKKLV